MERGFTFIELMIVVTVVGILTSIAMPLYGDYTARAQVTEAFSIASGMKVALADFYTTYGRLPEGNIEAGLYPYKEYETKYIENIDTSASIDGSGAGPTGSVAHGQSVKGSGRVFINVKFHEQEKIGSAMSVNAHDKVAVNSRIAGKSMVLIGNPMGAIFHWSCGGGRIDHRGAAEKQKWAPLEDKYLPSQCRGNVPTATP